MIQSPFAPWTLCARPPGSIKHPNELLPNAAWIPALVPGTVAASLQAQGQWHLGEPFDGDGQDFWYHTSFAAPAVAQHGCFLHFSGLATLCEVWLSGERILTTDNMFRAYRIDIGPFLQPHNELFLAFLALNFALNQKRPRPRWKTNLVSHQQLRWFRTTLLGRMPGWSPPVAPVGPWRDVHLECAPLYLQGHRLNSSLAGNTGQVLFQARLHSSSPPRQATLRVGDAQAVAEIQHTEEGWAVTGTVTVLDPPLWWPHTHGPQPLLPCSLKIETDEESCELACGAIGFRQIEVPDSDHFAIRVNGVPVYCRGACWTTNDVVTLQGAEDSLRHDLLLSKNAGANLLRIGGTMGYESDAFYQLCDELGLMVWQDFPFANMDYPVEDPAFAANITAEAVEQLGRLSRHPSVIVYCGNSEVEQQAAMLGVPRAMWRNNWFAERLPALCAAHHPGTAYVPSTPSGGTMPFHVGTGLAHFYGVGAYLRLPNELRAADVQFSPECLAFSNVPEAETALAVMPGSPLALHEPRWKQRVPRDVGAGWDFEDVRDFYLRHLFAVDPVRLRSFDPPRYLALSRVVSGEMMTQVFAEWRSSRGNNSGGLVWFFKDLWPGAGWGIVDSRGIPKAAYYYLRRVWSPLQILITDEGLDGLLLHPINETPEPFRGTVELLLLRDGHVVVARQEAPCEIAPRAQVSFAADEVLGGFYDVNYAYRFGPLRHDVVIATLFDGNRKVVSDHYYFPQQREPAFVTGVELEAQVADLGCGTHRVTLRSNRFLHAVSFDVSGFLPNDNYFHLPPDRQATVDFTPCGKSAGPFQGHVEALNLRDPVAIVPRPAL